MGLLLLGLHAADSVALKILVNIPSIPLLSGKMFVVNVGLMIGTLFTFALNITLLIARRSFRRMTPISGGLLAFEGCFSIRLYRILGYLFVIIMSVLWYSGIILLIAAETYGPTQTSFHFVCYSLGCIFISLLLSIPLKEYTNTNIKKPVVVVLLSIGFPIVLVGLFILAFGTAVY